MFIERDPKNAKMQADLFSRMSEIVSNFDPSPQHNNTNSDSGVTFVDMESAIKELLAMGAK